MLEKLENLACEMADYIWSCADDGIVPSMWDALSFKRDLKKILSNQEDASSEELED